MMIKKIFLALSGRRVWKKTRRKYGVKSKDYIIMMNECDMELNEIALKHIDDMLEYRKGEKVLILSNDIWIRQNARQYSDNIIDIVTLPEKKMDSLLCFYNLYFFSEYFILISQKKSHCKTLKKAVNINGITKEDIVCLCMYLIRTWEREETNG